MSRTFDITVIGGGIIGISTAMHLQLTGKYSAAVIEAEDRLAMHQTGNNSGVIHSGIYYQPGSLKAVNCVEGKALLYNFCKEHGIKYEQCGKLIIAVNEDEVQKLTELEARGRANGISKIKRLCPEEIKEYEPHAAGIAGLYVPDTGIVDYTEVTNAFAKLITQAGGEIQTRKKFLSLQKDQKELILETTGGEVKTKFLVNCGGLYSDRIAKKCRVKPNLQIVPFRGEYYKLRKEKECLVKNLIYPVPDPRFPFLGVHFTRMINGGIEAGPNAVLALKREGYKKSDFSVKDIWQMITSPDFWQMAAKYYKLGIEGYYRSFSRKAFVRALQKLIPELDYDDIVPAGSGVRAQALEAGGKLIDDFRIIETEKMIHVLNAPSPAATASLSIGKKIAEMTMHHL